MSVISIDARRIQATSVTRTPEKLRCHFWRFAKTQAKKGAESSGRRPEDRDLLFGEPPTLGNLQLPRDDFTPKRRRPHDARGPFADALLRTAQDFRQFGLTAAGHVFQLLLRGCSLDSSVSHASTSTHVLVERQAGKTLDASFTHTSVRVSVNLPSVPKIRRGIKTENFTQAEINALAAALDDALVDETQQAFADRVKISQQTVSRLIGRKGGLTRPSADAIARGLPGEYRDAAAFFTEQGIERTASLPAPPSAYDAYSELRMAVVTARSRLQIPAKTIEREIERAGGPNPHWRRTRWVALFANAHELEQDIIAEAPATRRKRSANA